MTSSQGWIGQREVGSRFFLAILIWVAFKLGRAPARILLIFITGYFYLTGTKARKASRNYLQRRLKRKPRWSETFHHFYFFAAVTLDRLFLLTGKFSDFAVTIHGGSIFTDLKATRRGCLLFVSHLGSFDAMRIPGAREQALPISILMDRGHNSMAMQLITRLDPVLAGRVIDARQPKAELVLKMNDILMQGGMIGIMVDRLHEQETGIECSLLGGNVKLPAGPWQLASALQVPVVLCFGLYHGRNRYSVHFEKFDCQISNRRRERNAAMENYVQLYCQRLEHYLSLEPYNWFNFYEFWKDDTPGN
jgi:predicted LPLAT superfamily acyltransferase